MQLQLKIRRCPNSDCERFHKPYRPEAEGQWALPQHEFGLNVVVLVGTLRYREQRSVPQIHQQLQTKGLSVSERTVSNLLAGYDELVSLKVSDAERIRDIVGQQRQRVHLAIDTSLLWNQFCLIEVCLIWGGRAIPLAQRVLEHASATVAFEQYQWVLESARDCLPAQCSVILLADRGFEHGALIRWLEAQGWGWCIRAKSDLQVWLHSGKKRTVAQLFPHSGQAALFSNVTVLEDIRCQLAVAYFPSASEA